MSKLINIFLRIRNGIIMYLYKKYIDKIFIPTDSTAIYYKSPSEVPDFKEYIYLRSPIGYKKYSDYFIDDVEIFPDAWQILLNQYYSLIKKKNK